MNEDLHRRDEYLKNVYKHFEEEPSQEVWDKINARLDRRDMIYYRKKLVTWKRIACLLLLLLGCIFIYENFFTTNQEKFAEINIRNNKNTALSNSKADSSLAFKSNKNRQLIESEAAKISLKKSTSTSESRNRYYNNLHQKGIVASEKRNAIQQGAATKFFSSTKPLGSLTKIDNTIIKKTELQQWPDGQIGPLLKDNSASVFNNHANNFNNQKIESDTSDVNSMTVTNEKKQFSTTLQNPVNAQVDSRLKNERKNTKNINIFKSYWSFTPYISADLTHYKLDNNDIINSGNGLEDKNEIEERESHEFSFSAGVLARWQRTEKVSFKTGIVYSNVAIAIQPQTLHATADGNQNFTYKIITSSGYAYVQPVFGDTPAAGDSISLNVSQHHLHYFYLPAMLNYTIAAGKNFSIAAGAGISTNILLSTKVETEVDDDMNREHVIINKLQGLRPFYFSIITDAELQFKMNRQVNFTLLPTFKYAINPIAKNNVVKTYPYSFGLGAGITYRF